MAKVKWLVGWRWQPDLNQPWRIFEEGEVALNCSEEMLAVAKPEFYERVEDEPEPVVVDVPVEVPASEDLVLTAENRSGDVSEPGSGDPVAASDEGEGSPAPVTARAKSAAKKKARKGRRQITKE